jgi:hypothetical protein
MESKSLNELKVKLQILKLVSTLAGYLDKTKELGDDGNYLVKIVHEFVDNVSTRENVLSKGYDLSRDGIWQLYPSINNDFRFIKICEELDLV